MEIIKNDFGEKVTPSYVAFTETQKLVGNEAKIQMKRNLKNTIFGIKRLIGYRYGKKEFEKDFENCPFKVVKESDSNKPKIEITYKNEQKKLYIEEILAMELLKLKQIATNYIGKEPEGAVIGIPACFNLTKTQIIKDAGSIAGLNIIRAISEPALACFAYAMNKKLGKAEENILVFDFGGGFLSVSLMVIEDGLYEVKAHFGNNHLGGEDLDNRLVDYCASEFLKKTSKDFRQNQKALNRVKIECEKAKRSLSSTQKAFIEINSLMEGEDLYLEITRDKFEELCLDLFKKCIGVVLQVFEAAKMDKKKIDTILLVGNSSRIPKIQSMLQELFYGIPLNKSIISEESVSFGAAIQAAIINNIKDENIEKLVLLDVTTSSIGIETSGGVMDILIPRNSSFPTKKTHCYSTYEDYQSSFLAQIFEGEEKLTKDNVFLGKIRLEGIPPKKKGEIKIIITFSFDPNDILNVTIEEESSKKKKSMNIIFGLGKDKLNEIKAKFENFIKEESKQKENLIKKEIPSFFQVKNQH